MSQSQRRIISVPDLPDPPGWSHAVSAGGWLFGGATMASDPVGKLVPAARPRPSAPWAEEPLDLESRLILERMTAILKAGGSDIGRDLIRLWQWIAADYPDERVYAASREHWPCFPSGTPYARNAAEMIGDPLRSSTGIGVRQLPVPGAMLSVDFIAAAPGSMHAKQAVALPPDLPQPKIGYSPITRLGDWIFLAGFGATDFKGDWGRSAHFGARGMVAPEARLNPYIWLGSEIETQTEFTLSAMKRMAEAAGTSLDRCVKADVTITHPSDFAGMDRVWRRYFGDAAPARNVVTGAQLVLKGLRVEIAMLLLAGDAVVARDEITLPDLPPVAGHAPHAVHAGDFLFTSSLLPLGPEGGVPAMLRTDDHAAAPYHDQAERQTDLVIETLELLCSAAGSSLGDVCKIQAFLADRRHLPGMLGAWRRAFDRAPPTLSAVIMGGGDPLLLPGAALQWDAIVFAPRGKV